ncbi:c-type cytochrome [uncultured Paludibaculum sp.]|uniref:c-type cytochrome n=1 Tax=uncultured Paludibaculum sp. TaxID=1765020 RepID=UPI002AABADD9|nr:c-type cytochrome [uncultured Paludibaculum sp.]
MTTRTLLVKCSRGLLFAACLAAASLYAQPPAPSNLQVLPKDMPRQELMGTMRAFNQALGVQCDFCHVPREFAKDDKEEKQVARAMLKMVMNIKENGDKFAPEGRTAKIACWTCHRGEAHITLPEPPAQGGGRPPAPKQ